MAPRSVVHADDYTYLLPSEIAKVEGMKMATNSASPRIKLANGVNFEPKKVRKAKRKALVRGYLANKAVDVRIEAADRAEFFRNLREMKMRRRKIAVEMRGLTELLRGLQRQVGKVEDRHPTIDLRRVDDAHDAVKTALSAATAAADDFHVFARRRIYYVKELAA